MTVGQCFGVGMLLLVVLVADVDLVLFVFLFLCSFFCFGGAVEPLYLVLID